MSHHRHTTTLRRHRKRSGFTQKELGFLLGFKTDAAVSRYEDGNRTPDLKTAFAYQILFGTQAGELFTGVHARAKEEIAERARELSEKISNEDPSPRGAYKRGCLARLTTAV
jgi:transcriptional regulator with XRE-family HTH domain